MSNYDPLPGIWEEAKKWETEVRRRCVQRAFQYGALFERWFAAIRRDGDIEDAQFNAPRHQRLSADGNTRAVVAGDSWIPMLAVAPDMIRMTMSRKRLLEDASGGFATMRSYCYALYAACAEAYRDAGGPQLADLREGDMWTPHPGSTEVSCGDWFEGLFAGVVDVWFDEALGHRATLCRRTKKLIQQIHVLLVEERLQRAPGPSGAMAVAARSSERQSAIAAYARRLAAMYDGYMFAAECFPLLEPEHRSVCGELAERRDAVFDEIWNAVAKAPGAPLSIEVFAKAAPARAALAV